MFKKNLFEVWFYNFNVNRNMSLRSFVASFKKISKSDFIQCFFMILYMYIAADQWQTTPGDKILMTTEISCHFAHLLQVSKKSLWSLILYIFFHDFIHLYSPRQGQTAPRRQSFDVNRTVLSLHSFVASLKNDVFEVWFYTLFYMI